MAIIGEDRDGFAVVSHQHSLNRTRPIRLKRDPLADPEFEHINVGAHLLQQAQALDDAVVKVDEFCLGQPVGIDRHAVSSVQLNEDPSYDGRHGATKERVDRKPVTSNPLSGRWRQGRVGL